MLGQVLSRLLIRLLCLLVGLWDAARLLWDVLLDPFLGSWSVPGEAGRFLLLEKTPRHVAISSDRIGIARQAGQFVLDRIPQVERITLVVDGHAGASAWTDDDGPPLSKGRVLGVEKRGTFKTVYLEGLSNVPSAAVAAAAANSDCMGELRRQEYDLLIELRPRLSLCGLNPWALRFAEIAHVPCLWRAVLEKQLVRAFARYSACKQNFGK